jgi:hypothetical protein
MKHITNHLPDVLMVGGAAALAYGSGLIHPAAGFIVGGILSMLAGVLAARTAK